MTQGSPLIMATWPARNSCAVFIRISDGIKDKNRPRIIGSVPVSSQAALLRQGPPGRAAFRKARDAGSGEPLPSLATPPGATCRATLRAGPVFARCGVSRRLFGTPNCTPRALPRAKTGYGAAAYETGTDPNQSV